MYFWCLFFLPELLMYLTQKIGPATKSGIPVDHGGTAPICIFKTISVISHTKKAGNMQTSLRINRTLQRTLTNSKLWAPPLKKLFLCIVILSFNARWIIYTYDM